MDNPERNAAKPPQAKQALLRMKHDALPVLIELLTSPEVDQDKAMSYVIEVLGEMKDESALQPLIDVLGRPRLGFYAAGALGELGDHRAVEPLIMALDDPNKNTRSGAARALGDLHDQRAVQPLIRVLQNSEDEARNSAANALGDLGDITAIEPLRKVARTDAKANVRKAAQNALKAIDPGALEPRASVSVRADGAVVRDLMMAGTQADKDDPLPIEGSDAYIYVSSGFLDEGKWKLIVPTGSRAYENREVILDVDKNPDLVVFEALRDAPRYKIDIGSGSKLQELLEQGKESLIGQIILIGNVAYLRHDGRGEWQLRIPTSAEAERSVPLSQLGPLDAGIGDRVLDAVAAAGLFLS